ncbi:hypothetical protein E2562_037082 [Oryza meyeriana var. granulata]|uniref:FBD domain-containing protein n=1 Tax=Oryza meyeriana var. granulata TaxID=110450 RepID=A0A6G1CJX0_9ORYZ|nr:hypothetical protein E2562_037082 [Oryza meyeriana var. granulata]KAF0900943.1 hypothetical protein E2562_037082 [Oryza meyeriana var. granulata]KAF0900945.1 hypothetical protein E2562_037082 [Oryza meyeriana var. granulata]KAF0900946.1 hypothetical protein E2562_037082 [Oryza meyeriana var. granulata]KAF0900947.1 hypothetical protein E2562_037082 [Oryza meyeriana var. granulata]
MADMPSPQAGRPGVSPHRRPRQHPLPPPHLRGGAHVHAVPGVAPPLGGTPHRRSPPQPEHQRLRRGRAAPPPHRCCRSFRLATRNRSWSPSAFHDWLLRLSRGGGLQDLELTLRYLYMNNKLNSCLFSLRELTSLRLYCCGLPHIAHRVRWVPESEDAVPLYGQSSEALGRELATLIAASPVLQEVTLIDAMLIGDGPDEDWVIRTSNLRKLTIALGCEYGAWMEDLPRLEECYLFGLNYAKYLMGMARVAKLTFYCNCMLVNPLAHFILASI